MVESIHIAKEIRWTYIVLLIYCWHCTEFWLTWLTRGYTNNELAGKGFEYTSTELVGRGFGYANTELAGRGF